MTDLENAAERLRTSEVAATIRRERLIVILRRVAPRSRLIGLVEELADAGARVFEVTFDSPAAVDDFLATRDALAGHSSDSVLLGAGTIRTTAALDAAIGANADFGVSPALDTAIVERAIARDLPFIAGALTPTEIDAAWRAGSTFVKVFPASSVGPGHVREIRGPMPEIELVPTGGIDVSSAGAFIAAGAVAVGIGGGIVHATREERATVIAAVRAVPAAAR